MNTTDASKLMKIGAANLYEAISLLANDPRPEAQAARDAWAQTALQLDTVVLSSYTRDNDAPAGEGELTIVTQRTHSGEDRPTIQVSVSVHVDKDAPRSLAQAVFQEAAKLITAGTDPDEQDQIARDFQEIADRNARETQNEADAAAKRLLGE